MSCLRRLPSLLLASVLLGGCPAGPTAVAGSAAADPWRAACALPAEQRGEALRTAALADASLSADPAARAALQRWIPRGRDGADRAQPVPAADRSAVAAVVRRGIAACGTDDAVALLGELVRFQTVAAVAPPADNPEFLALAQWLATWATGAGLEFHVSGAHDAWEIVLPGTARDRALAWVAHIDVVPVDDPPTLVAADAVPAGWSLPPFVLAERDGNLYGRGTEDDNGPVGAALIVLAALAGAGLAPDGDIVLVLGTAEEDDWDGMKRYAAQAPPSRNVVSIDAEFPVVVAEDGFVAWGLRAPLGAAPAAPAQAVALDARGGLFLTQVPDAAELWLRPGSDGPEELARRARAAGAARIAEWPDRSGFALDASVEERDGAPAVVVRATGRSIHASEPEDGANALWLLAGAARDLDLAPGGIRTLLEVIDRYFAGDDFGRRLALAYEDPLMGPLVAAPTVLRVADGQALLEVNMRRPAGRTTEEFQAVLDSLVGLLREEVSADLSPIDDVYVGTPYQVDPDEPLVRTLLDVYRAVAGDPRAAPVAVRGGTYARLFPGAVSFGPCRPGAPYHGHGADEYLERATLDLVVRTLFEATLRLGCAAGGAP